ncbi:MAG: hypothetical protein ACREJU_02200 [Nitrospiraceae bacterium]
MKLFRIIAGGTLAIGFFAGLVLANPSMLPNHPGYPAGGEFANDPGQKNQTGETALRESAASEDRHSVQNLKDSSNERLLETQGAGRLPKVEGPQITIEPPVKEGTRIEPSRRMPDQ